MALTRSPRRRERRPPPAWADPELLAFAREQFEAGASNDEIVRAVADRFGVRITRNSVAGISFRQCWSRVNRRKPGGFARPAKEPTAIVPLSAKRKAPPKRWEAQGRVAEVAPLPSPPKAPPPRPAGPKALLDLGYGECRWPVAAGLFCAAKVGAGSFCAVHRRMAYTPVQASRSASLARMSRRYS